MKRLAPLFLIALTALPLHAKRKKPPSIPISACPAEGDAAQSGVKALNRLKNRATPPTPDQINFTITLPAMLKPGDDRGRWKVKDGAEITGYVNDVKKGGIESCNCHANSDADRDTHIELVLDPMATGKTQRVVIEVTHHLREQMKAKGEDWSTKALRRKFLGTWVKITGWMLFDVEHQDEAENTAPGRERNWRATAWEIHPVTAIEVTNKPR